MAEMLHINEDTFKTEVLDSSQPVLVDFSAVWCQPCKMLDPIVKQLAGDWDGKVKVGKSYREFRLHGVSPSRSRVLGPCRVSNKRTTVIGQPAFAILV